MNQTHPAALPVPTLARWQPLRLGLVELFYYDSEEFWFRDGHLMLRGNNGTGKSKVLSLTLPFLLDAQLKPSRIEPDGDAGKRMAWNLLVGRHDRRMGYTWVEFGRVDENGEHRYLTLGCGLSAVAARPQVDSWFFMMDQHRIGQDLWLMSPTRVVLTRERLREALQRHSGQIFDTAAAYRRAVDERLFHLGSARYAALMDTLIQLRQPQLSKKPDEASLSNALTEALPPLSTDLLADVADALNQLEEYRRELSEYEALERAVGQFSERYRLYAATQTRRQARILRSAQTGFDTASRRVNDARATLRNSEEDEARAAESLHQAESALTGHRARLEALQSDPAMTDAKALEKVESDARQRRKDFDEALRAHQEMLARLERERHATLARAQRAGQAEAVLAQHRHNAGLAAEEAGFSSAYRASPLSDDRAHALDAPALDVARRDLRQAIGTRREQVALLRQRCGQAEAAAQAHGRAQTLRDERADDAAGAAARRGQADEAVEREGGILLEAWQNHLDTVRQLEVPNRDTVLDDLAAWAATLKGENPAQQALHQAQQAASLRLAGRLAELRGEEKTWSDERAILAEERIRLERGEDTRPSAPFWRSADESRASRDGAPLWQLVDFQTHVTPGQRAGLEAALQASELLDAWIMPDGTVLGADHHPFPHDVQWVARPQHVKSLAGWLTPASTAAERPLPVAPGVVQRLLEGVACDTDDMADAETWVAPDGRFRLGALAGAWHKAEAEFIGYAARAEARRRRLGEIARRLDAIEQALGELRERRLRIEADQQRAAREWRDAPTDDPLRTAHAEAASCAREFQLAALRLEQAENELRSAAADLETARETLARDAEDLRLPPAREALDAVDGALMAFADTLHAVAGAAREFNGARAEHTNQLARQEQAHADAEHAAEHAAEREAIADDIQARLESLRESVGAKVEALKEQIANARQAVREGEATGKRCNEGLRLAGESRARAEQQTEAAENVLEERSAARQHAVRQLRDFCATGLAAAALPDMEIPAADSAWTLETALTLARRAEQQLANVKDDDDTWSRIQSRISQDYTELGRALAALSHQAQAETSDFGLMVSIIYQNRPQRPDELGAHLADEIAQRRELLTAGERKVLENHLQAEIASAVQKLLRDADRQVNAINTELRKRPTSTGVRFHLKWETLPEGADGAPVGLAAARDRLLNKSPDLWSADERRAVGEMLQQRIAAERSRADAGLGGSLLEQLARALDYRRWHRFRVLRWDGKWVPLSGPASSGERALGLTVPLFAAVSSYYTQEGYAHAPRLVLLDEVFAGIDDSARAHCWALIREFDLDFVVTSEREWACSAELPGVAIAQLQRRENIDAVYVSRWTWDGHARRRDHDPDRRYPPE